MTILQKEGFNAARPAHRGAPTARSFQPFNEYGRILSMN
jgi:hypothetical protein